MNSAFRVRHEFLGYPWRSVTGFLNCASGMIFSNLQVQNLVILSEIQYFSLSRVNLEFQRYQSVIFCHKSHIF